MIKGSKSEVVVVEHDFAFASMCGLVVLDLTEQLLSHSLSIGSFIVVTTIDADFFDCLGTKNLVLELR